jgi:hypothetical protein
MVAESRRAFSEVGFGLGVILDGLEARLAG